MLDQLALPQLPPDTPIDQVLSLVSEKVPLFALTEVEIRGEAHKVFAAQPPNITGLFPLMAQHGDKPFLVYGDERISFKEALARSAKLSRWLVEDFSLKKGDRVMIAMRNYPEWLISFLGVTAVGGVAVLVNAWWQEDELTWALDNAEPSLVIADQARLARMKTSLPERRIPLILVRGEGADGVLGGSDTHRLSDILARETEPGFPQVEIQPEDDCAMLYTSGSTGFPKGAVLQHRSFVAALMGWVAVGLAFRMLGEVAAEDDPQEAILVAVPFFHVTGLVPVTLGSAIAGRKLVIMHRWEPEEAFSLIEAERVSNVTGVPTMTYELSVHPARADYDLSSLRVMGGGGSARPASHLEKMQDAYERVKPGIGYGLTETTSLGAAQYGDAYLQRPDSVGRATPPLVDIKIMDDAGNSLPTGQVGEVCIKTVANLREYWKDEQATRDAFFGAYFRSGDLGRMDDDGFIYIVDRKKDIIIRGGENISTQEVEAALSAIEGVEGAVVFSLPDEALGEIVAALVYCPSGKPGGEGIVAALKGHLAAFKIPQRIWVTEDRLATIASGKVDRHLIKQQYRQEFAKLG